MKRRYKLQIAYDGARYFGWQRQKNAPSVQGEIERALHNITGSYLPITGSGRTDAGVHAVGQIAHVDSLAALDHTTINLHLPEDISILSLEEVDTSFHARYSAVGKVYEYRVQIAPVYDPSLRLYTHHILDFNQALFEEKTGVLIGKHNFQSFVNAGSQEKNPYKEIRAITMHPKDYGAVFRFEADGFLYKMVRNLMGALLDSKITKKVLQNILNGKDRKKLGKPAPAKGLFLVDVHYP